MGDLAWGTGFLHASTEKVIRFRTLKTGLRGFGRRDGEGVQRRGVRGEVNLPSQKGLNTPTKGRRICVHIASYCVDLGPILGQTRKNKRDFDINSSAQGGPGAKKWLEGVPKTSSREGGKGEG